MLLIQKYLLDHSFAQLAADHGIYPSFSKSGHKFSLNYDMIEAKEADPLAQECRGLILTTGEVIAGTIDVNGKVNRDYIIPGETKIIACPMFRFFNNGQGSAANINWLDPRLEILEKCDGTLGILHADFITGAWHVATRSCPEADIPLESGLYTFRTLFEKCLKDTNGLTFDEFTSKLDRNITYCFEICSPFNTIVVKYPNCSLTLLAARDLNTLKEININTLDIGIPHVQAYALTDINAVIDWVSSLNPLEHEGVVIKDSNFNRIKVKNANYVAFSKARDTLGSSERNCLELILHGKEDDVLAALPQEIVENLLRIKNSVVNMFKDYDLQYLNILEEANSILPGDKKTFAITLQKYKELWQAPFYHIYAGKSKNIKEFIFNSKKEGTWSNSILDKILEISSKY